MPSKTPADVIVFNKGGRDFRAERLAANAETPREFFYGYYELGRAGISAAMLSSSDDISGLRAKTAAFGERAFAGLTQLGVRPFYVRQRAPEFNGAKVLMSYTDGFSLSLGLGYPRKGPRPILMGGFHGLTDIETRAPAWALPLVRRTIAQALSGLDHAFFFGATDRQVAMDRYGLTAERSSVIPFGVDTEFWRPLPDVSPADVAVAVGQDPNRDYDLLASAPGNHPIRIVTRRPVRIPEGRTNVSTTVGDFFDSASMSDEDIRRLYNLAFAVVVPVKDINQPSGYSVSLQAMSCGRPVIISRIRGLWATDVLKDGVNCILVPPGDAPALGDAIGRVRADRDFAQRLGVAARETAVAQLGLDKIGSGTVDLARLGLRLHDERSARMAA